MFKTFCRRPVIKLLLSASGDDCVDADDGVLIYRTGLGNNGKKAVMDNFHYEVLAKKFLKEID